MPHIDSKEWTAQQREEYIRINLAIANFLLSTRAALSIGDFIEQTAPVIELLLTGQLRLASENEINTMRAEARKLLGDARKPCSKM